MYALEFIKTIIFGKKIYRTGKFQRGATGFIFYSTGMFAIISSRVLLLKSVMNRFMGKREDMWIGWA